METEARRLDRLGWSLSPFLTGGPTATGSRTEKTADLTLVLPSNPGNPSQLGTTGQTTQLETFLSSLSNGTDLGVRGGGINQ